jgi:predicted ATP-dependent serine protease
MAYFCKDCSYRGKKSGQLGECPACGSFNIAKDTALPDKQPTTTGKWRLIVLALLWLLLITLIIGKLVQ